MLRATVLIVAFNPHLSPPWQIEKVIEFLLATFVEFQSPSSLGFSLNPRTSSVSVRFLFSDIFTFLQLKWGRHLKYPDKYTRSIPLGFDLAVFRSGSSIVFKESQKNIFSRRVVENKALECVPKIRFKFTLNFLSHYIWSVILYLEKSIKLLLCSVKCEVGVKGCAEVVLNLDKEN